MKIALDPYMLRHTPLLELPALVAELGYEYIELSPREDFMPFFLHPRADDGTVAAFDTEFQEWINAVGSGQGPTGPSSWDGYAAQVVCDAGVSALYSGDRVPIELGEKPDLYLK